MSVNFDTAGLPTPCYIIDEARLIHNLEILKGVEDRTGAKILLAQKAFSCYHVYPLIAEYISGTACSGLFEAKLGYEEMGKENHVFSAAYRESEIDEIISYCGHIIFNSFSQLDRYRDRVLAAGKKVMAMDEKILNLAGRKLYEEMAFAMNKDVSYAQQLFEDAVKAESANTLLIGA